MQLNIKNASTVIMDNDDVLFHWAMISVNWNEEEASALLSMMVEHWITLLLQVLSLKSINNLSKRTFK